MKKKKKSINWAKYFIEIHSGSGKAELIKTIWKEDTKGAFKGGAKALLFGKTNFRDILLDVGIGAVIDSASKAIFK